MKQPPAEDPRLTAALAKFAPAMRATILDVRAALQRRFPTAFELIYDNYNFFVIGYSATERPSDCVVAIAADAKRVSLSFYRGADVPDPAGLLRGSGKQNRFLRLPAGAASLDGPGVAALLDAAAATAPKPMRTDGAIETIVRSVSAKQRPRRA